ncbi:SMP-30/gluconolactonase/LRE family protein [Rhodobacteraceae bacterium nBUS_24]|jgi:sugar lactone lactonase YvrE|nr:SMP-30/gluconolactonase/LRE family protein [Marinovum sp.]MBT6099695.1 SMP-30/gluconolactonase/LRE family protein [Marinovum sp.]MBT6508055.1 SMP-30/gluconolactonase/LRE family protein [Marinovum sp.]MBT7908128.1 SMP-30/gluconolactonase/LRE family protein [Marinovum sp.]MDG2231344.1 SMP-30/gluconolactonase/LRE family protein [Paracoccaceae bacterium]
MTVFDPTPCKLGEGPLWHPILNRLFWFDILSNKLHMAHEDEVTVWDFPGHVSAAGWIDQNSLLIASETALEVFDILTGRTDRIVALEADNPKTRSNDGRADPWGGFWIGTMAKDHEKHAGAIYRYYRGELRKLLPNISISNAICFAPDGSFAYFADTPCQSIQKWQLSEADGWPVGEPEQFVDLRPQNLNPDGAVVDAAGNIWNAQWGAHRVAVYDPEGNFLDQITFPASQISCPAFGGANLSTLFVTSAATGVREPLAGQTFFKATEALGQAEHQVIL